MSTNRSIATASPGRFGHIGRFCRFSIRYIKPPSFGMNEGLATGSPIEVELKTPC